MEPEKQPDSAPAPEAQAQPEPAPAARGQRPPGGRGRGEAYTDMPATEEAGGWLAAVKRFLTGLLGR